jgi:hypothetical protein
MSDVLPKGAYAPHDSMSETEMFAWIDDRRNNDGPMYERALARRLHTTIAFDKGRIAKLEANQRTEGTIEVCLSCRESTLLWDPTKGVCGGGASRHMCPMMQALRAAKDAT